MHKFILQSRRH